MLRLHLALVRPRLATYYPTSATRPRLSLPSTALHPHALSRCTVCTRPHRRTFTTDTQEAENLNVSHSRFLAEKSRSAKWKEDDEDWGGETDLKESEDFDNLAAGKGKLSPTSSHLFKLILPLGALTSRIPSSTRPVPSSSPPNSQHSKPQQTQVPPPTVFLLHPAQPLTHVSRLILSSFAPARPSVTFRSVSPSGQMLEWSESTDVGDFIRDAARATEFTIHISPSPFPPSTTTSSSDDGHEDSDVEDEETVITVEVPTFADRTRFLRRRLQIVEGELKEMEGLKTMCDRLAHKGARRMAVTGFGILVVYWGAVARLTFWDYGWDVMEPITYLSGLSTVICGYLWFLYQGREVSYSSVLDRSVLARRQALYKTHGLDIERWAELQADARRLRREIGDIAQDYDQNWRRGAPQDGDGEGGGKKGGEEVGGVDESKGSDGEVGDARDEGKSSKGDEMKGKEESSRSSDDGGEEGGEERKTERENNAKHEMEREVSAEVRGEVGGSVADGKGIEDARDGGNGGSEAEKEMRGEKVKVRQDREDERDGKGA
ncbi:uncharacterized protein STEHIDRAFT_146606 [Stereum hirsutum FP-91666 SS1]|uniref:uncharacterized protein n=1 Tax=Stereum hirsutum (strain FP-91666) TaxID=721885 RepID=UPI000440E326|nr:uncharacterized protein STEHIDRAFT_146606 [Stereum hirsutum FP-91666 SS1]EIM87039.1 hypothetical protein STEHIDRAFT_146606 [Stereum hirsutum FP-91666 SS1]